MKQEVNSYQVGDLVRVKKRRGAPPRPVYIVLEIRPFTGCVAVSSIEKIHS